MKILQFVNFVRTLSKFQKTPIYLKKNWYATFTRMLCGLFAGNAIIFPQFLISTSAVMTHFPSLVPSLPPLCVYALYIYLLTGLSCTACTTTVQPISYIRCHPLKANRCVQLQVLSSEGLLTIRELIKGPEWFVMNDWELCVSTDQ